MTNEELDRIEFQSHGQDERAIRFLRAQLAEAQDFIRKAGHLPGCEADYCIRVGLSGKCLAHKLDHMRGGPWHEFHPGPCSCGHAAIVGGEGE